MLLKTLWEKEKMLVTSIFSFSHNVFLLFPTQSSFLYSLLLTHHFTFILSSASAFNLEQFKSFNTLRKRPSFPIMFFTLPKQFSNFHSFFFLQVLSIWQSLKLLTTLTNRPFENIMGKGENCGNQHFLLFQ